MFMFMPCTGCIGLTCASSCSPGSYSSNHTSACSTAGLWREKAVVYQALLNPHLCLGHLVRVLHQQVQRPRQRTACTREQWTQMGW